MLAAQPSQVQPRHQPEPRSQRLISLDFEGIVQGQKQGDWDGMGRTLADAARRLEASGADCVLIATNTMHRVAPAVHAAVKVPVLHIVDVAAKAVRAAGFDAVGVLGTRFTMEQPFYVNSFTRHAVGCVMPDELDRAEVHRIIFDELCKGEVRDASRQTLREIVAGVQSRGAQGLVLGCTELAMILREGDVPLPVFDTTLLHAMAAVDFALAG